MRNSPTVVGAAYNRWFYWDGRRDSLWSQALIPIESEDELAGSRVGILKRVLEDEELHEFYKKIFGPMPETVLESLSYFVGPFTDSDGRDAWFGLTGDQQRVLNVAFSNLGKSLEAYQRTLLPEPTRFDFFVEEVLEDGSSDLLSDQELNGLRLFIDGEKTQCLQCHNGPLLTNGEFHNVGSGGFTGERLDFGREIGLRAVLMDEFNCIGPYSDAEPTQCRELLFLNRDSHLPMRGAFKVPSLRALDVTAPYFHDGRFDTLTELIEFYSSPPDQNEVGPHELRDLALNQREIDALVAFLLTLSEKSN